MPGAIELLILCSVPLVGLLLIISAIFRLRKKLSQSEKPTLGTYINELGVYAFVGLILLVGGIVYATTQLRGGNDPKANGLNQDQQPAVDMPKETPIRAGGQAEPASGKLGLDLFVPETPQRPLNDEPILEALRANREFDRASSPGFESLQRGRDLAKAEKYEEAAQAFTDAIEKDPKLWPAFQERGRLLASFGIHDQAAKDFTDVLRLTPGLQSAYKDRASSWYALGEMDKTIDDCTSALRGNFADPEVFNLRGLARSYKGDNRRAIEDFTAALRLDPKLALVFSNRAHSLMAMGALSEALADCDRAVRLDPNLPQAYHRRGRIHRSMKKWSEAMKDFDKAIELDPQFATAYADRALARITATDAVAQNPEQAVMDAKKACELTGWQDFIAVEVLARSYAEAGQAEDAQKTADLMVQLAPPSHRTAAEKTRTEILNKVRR